MSFSQTDYIDIITQNEAEFRIEIAALAMLVYDSFLTLPQEVNLIWRRKISFASMLYMMTRYATICHLLVDIVYDFSTTEFLLIDVKLCNVLNFVGIFFRLLVSFSSQSLLFGRAYAVSSRNRPMMVILGLLFAGNQIALLLWLSRFNCLHGFYGIIIKLAVSPILNLLFDIAIVSTTILQIWQMRQSFRFHLAHNTLTLLFLRQSIIFTLIAIWNLVDILGVTVSIMETNRVFIYAIAASLDNAVYAILICRFLLQLREHGHAPSKGSGRTTGTSTTILWEAVHRLDSHIIAEFGDRDLANLTYMSEELLELPNHKQDVSDIQQVNDYSFSPITRDSMIR